jgi:nitrous oxide reductase accessory protein NosL
VIPARPIADEESEIAMDRLNRRQFMGNITLLTFASMVTPLSLAAQSHCQVDHPLAPPDPVFSERCPNCGMTRSLWARTWKSFRLAENESQACSFHCLAEMALKAGQPPQNVRTALFLQPRGMVPAEAGWYVVGSSIRGTMTRISKAAFASRSAASDFARSCGGDVMGYQATYAMAGTTIERENAMIDQKRVASGKIIPPVDLKDECVVCHMYPSRYPRHRSQVSRFKGRIDHFCSTHCLFIWLGDAGNRAVLDGTSGMVWVTDFATGRWISGRTAYYVVDSRFMGPMGAEAVAFDRLDQAHAFVRNQGGRVLEFHQIQANPSAWGQPS